MGSINGGYGASSGSSTYVSGFLPVLGGGYYFGGIYGENERGIWWGSTAYSDAIRSYLRYNGTNLYTDYSSRPDGHYIRCVSEEKDGDRLNVYAR